MKQHTYYRTSWRNTTSSSAITAAATIPTSLSRRPRAAASGNFHTWCPQNFWIFDHLPHCPYLQLIYITKLTQPPLLRPIFYDPLTPQVCMVCHIWMVPQRGALREPRRLGAEQAACAQVKAQLPGGRGRWSVCRGKQGQGKELLGGIHKVCTHRRGRGSWKFVQRKGVCLNWYKSRKMDCEKPD